MEEASIEWSMAALKALYDRCGLEQVAHLAFLDRASGNRLGPEHAEAYRRLLEAMGRFPAFEAMRARLNAKFARHDEQADPDDPGRAGRHLRQQACPGTWGHPWPQA